MKKKPFKINHEERFDAHYRVIHKKFEYLRRRAFNAGHSSVNQVIDDLFPKTWRQENDRMREEHRKLGYKDPEFYHAAVKRRMGLKATAGRHKRALNRSHGSV